MSIDIKDLVSTTPNIGIGAKARSLGICLIFAGVDGQSMVRTKQNNPLPNNDKEKNEPKKHINILKKQCK
tara:strand:- start:483 stop:692 length:210 start_codon:yes stop_codon:yes gene_type:complete